MSIHFTVKIAADAAANTEYPVTIAVQAADYAAENLLDVTCTNGKVTVKAAVMTDYIPYISSSYNVAENNSLLTEAHLQKPSKQYWQKQKLPETVRFYSLLPLVKVNIHFPQQ